MTEHSPKQEPPLKNTLQVLVKTVGLTPQEISQLRLANLHLVGKNPNITFTPEGQDEAKELPLDLEAHRALVGWLVSRPDSISDFLFPGDGDQAISLSEIENLLKDARDTRNPEPTSYSIKTVDPSTLEEAENTESSVGEATMMSESRMKPPLSAPEIGVPPPGLDRTKIDGAPPTMPPEQGVPSAGHSTQFSPSKPPVTAPEENEKIDIPLPTSAPRTQSETSSPDSTSKDKSLSSSPPEGEKKSSEKNSSAVKSEREKESTETSMPPIRSSDRRSPWRMIPLVGVIGLLALCVICGIGGWFAYQSDAGQTALASLGLSNAAVEIASEPNELEESTDESDIDDASVEDTASDSPLATPTLEPSLTPTPLEPTETLAPTETPTSVPTDTPPPTSEPTETPIPTDTPEPTATLTPIPTDPPESVAPDDDTSTPESSLTPAMKYDAPVLLSPEESYPFIFGNTIVLRWEPVGELASDEQYAVRIRYSYQGEITYQGTNLRETEWQMPLSLFGLIDPPENKYEWFVVVERIDDDGSGASISPVSEVRTFTWN